jgi:hypothetical protein
MKMDATNQPNDEEMKKLQAALRRLEKERVFVPGDVDEAILARVREHFGQEKAGQAEEGAEVIEEIGAAGVIDATPRDDARPPAAIVIGDSGLFRKKPVKVRRPVRRWQRWLPLAASIAIAAVMVQFARMGRLAPGDVNADGRVDVIDALVLAERVRSGETRRGWDLNGDRVVDARDSEEIMARAVDLERSGS